MSIKTYLYPSMGSDKAKNITDVSDLATPLVTAVVQYCKAQKISDPQMITLPGINAAEKAVKDYKKEIAGTKNQLSVRGGISDKGHLVVGVSGILPRKGKPVKIADEIVVRKDFKVMIDKWLAEANAVVKLQKGDAIIDRAADRQAKKFGAKVESPDDADFGVIKTGNVILSAHGGRAEVNGTIIGTALGKRTAEQLVALLTKGPDKAKRLRKDFSGTVWLSGCFTAAGGIAPPGKAYDYESYAHSVFALLKKAGYEKATVKGHPGTARTDAEGNKSAVTPSGQKDYDKLKAQVKKLDTDIKAASDALKKLKADHADDPDALQAHPGYRKQIVTLNELRKLSATLNAEKETHVIDGLVAAYGRQAR